jgi:predicted RNase H-like nuclease (RuvC/YqgF family)
LAPHDRGGGERDRWSYGMRMHGPARRSGMFEDLFAERQVYLRSGLRSQYVVLSRPLQIGVAIAMVLLIAWSAWASYSAIAKRFELSAQSRELARLEAAQSSLRHAAETAEASAAGLRNELASLRAQAPAGDGTQTIADIKQPRGEEVVQLKATLASARARIAELTADLDAAKRPPATGAQAAGAAAGANSKTVADLEAELAAAHRRIAELQSKLAQPAPLPPPRAPR